MLLLSARWPRLPGRRDISKWTKIWGILLGHALLAGGIWEEDVLTSEIQDLDQLDASAKIISQNPRRLNAKEVLRTQKDGEFVFLVADGSAKLSGRDYGFQEPTLRREFHRWGERILADNLTAMEKSFDLKNKKMTQKIGKTLHLFRDTSVIVIILNREFNLRAERRIIKIYIFERYSSEKKCTMRGEDWRKAKTSEAKTNSVVLILQGKDGILYLVTTLRKNSFRWKEPEEALHLIPFEGESKHMLSRLAAQRIYETNFFK